MTTNETSWFRDGHPYEALSQLILPDFAKKRVGDMRIWSAACSSGQEPYSISMSIQEYMSSRPGSIGASSILATDISPSILKEAREGVYEENVLARGLSEERRKRHFRQLGSCWKLKPELRSRVQFREVNLLKDFTALGRFDVIFCRNVLIYFSVQAKRDILARLCKALKPHGYLLLGGSESIAGHSDEFETVRFKQWLVYQAKTR